MKVVIVGGGIAGLSAAHYLCKYRNIQVELYERESKVGGQARSDFGTHCYNEYSWRVFNKSYINLFNIFKDIDILDNFMVFTGLALLVKGNQVFENSTPSNFDKMKPLLTQCKERLFNDYDNVVAIDYFENDEVWKFIIGPFLGLEVAKASLSELIRQLHSFLECDALYESEAYVITKDPTSISIFDPWKKYLVKHGVKIYCNSEIALLNTNGNEIEYIVNKNKKVYADEFIFACSLEPLINLCEMSSLLRETRTLKNMKNLVDSLQLYFTFNVYLKEKLDTEYKSFCIGDAPWQPMCQAKDFWRNTYLKKCNPEIKQIWNVGVYDYYPGRLHGKRLSECSKEEAIEETLYQLENSIFMRRILKEKLLEDIILDTDVWYEFKNNENNELISTNRKFSLNVGKYKYQPTTQPKDLPQNMYLSGYYTRTTMGGIGMERSCESGLNAVDKILSVYNAKKKIKIFKHNKKTKYLSKVLIPFVFLDKILYKLKMKPIFKIK